MPLPDLIEIIPLDKTRARGDHRAGIEEHHEPRAHSRGAGGRRSDAEGALWSEDTQVMTEALRTLGFEVRRGE